MKPILNKIAIIAGLSLLASCQSFFDEDPVYSTTTDTFFNSETALETYAIGFLESHLPSAATLTRGDQYSDICVTTQTEGFLKTGVTAPSRPTTGRGATGVRSTTSTITSST